jgi:16S rRNA processing protein RimM
MELSMAGDRILLGIVAAPHGVRGLVRIRSFTEDPMAVAGYGPLSDETGKKRFTVEALSASRGAVLARIEGVADRNAAEALRGLKLYIERERLPATAESEWYEADLIGLAAVGKDGRDWGKVKAFHDFGAGLTMEVTGGTASRDSLMLPFNDEVVPEVDLEGGKVIVNPPEGLLAGTQAKEAKN